MTIDEFWEWMSDRSAELLEADGQEVADRVEERLRAIDARIGVEVSQQAETREMIITAWSDREAFDVVRDIVAAAPPLEGWEIIALKPPRGFAFEIDLDGLHIDASELMFDPLSAQEDPKLLGVREQYELRVKWLERKHQALLPMMRRHGIGMWIGRFFREEIDFKPLQLGRQRRVAVDGNKQIGIVPVGQPCA